MHLDNDGIYPADNEAEKELFIKFGAVFDKVFPNMRDAIINNIIEEDKE